jgi:hypothetical protein
LLKKFTAPAATATMKMHRRSLIILIVCCLPAGKASAGCTDAPTSFAAAAFVAEVTPVSATVAQLADGRIVTRYLLAVSQNFKGGLPPRFTIETRGGVLGTTMDRASDSIDLVTGKSYIGHFSRDPADRSGWVADPFTFVPVPAAPAAAAALREFTRSGAQGPQPVAAASAARVSRDTVVPPSRLSATGYQETAESLPTRFTECDAGIELPYLVDLDSTKLPTGMTPAAALQIVANAFAAWAAAPSSLKFHFAGLYTATQAASTAGPTGFILVQLHDNFNSIASVNTLGTGGGRFTVGAFNGARRGGSVGSQPFEMRQRGYVVMNHRAPSLVQPSQFGQVLTHEIGHALGLDHSSEDPAEPNAILKDATMFYASNNDGRGTSIRLYDQDRIAFGYPLNTPPFSMDRVIKVVTGTPRPTGAGTDRVTLVGSDLQTPAAVTLSLVPDSAASGNGTFTASGNTIIFTPAGNFGDGAASAADIEAGAAYAKTGFQYSDGVNRSQLYFVSVTGFENDSTPADGLPDAFMNTYFGGTATGAAGTPRHPDSDPDKDGLSNRLERYLGTNPNDPKSGLPALSVDPADGSLTLLPNRYTPQIIESSADLATWTTFRLYHTVEAATPRPVVFSAPATVGPKQFYRVKITP